MRKVKPFYVDSKNEKYKDETIMLQICNGFEISLMNNIDW